MFSKSICWSSLSLHLFWDRTNRCTSSMFDWGSSHGLGAWSLAAIVTCSGRQLNGGVGVNLHVGQWTVGKKTLLEQAETSETFKLSIVVLHWNSLSCLKFTSLTTKNGAQFPGEVVISGTCQAGVAGQSVVACPQTICLLARNAELEEYTLHRWCIFSEDVLNHVKFQGCSVGSFRRKQTIRIQYMIFDNYINNIESEKKTLSISSVYPKFHSLQHTTKPDWQSMDFHEIHTSPFTFDCNVVTSASAKSWTLFGLVGSKSKHPSVAIT